MKTLFLLISILPTLAFGKPVFDVVVRSKSNRPEVRKVELEDISQDRFDGKYFKIVKGKSDEAILFTAEPELVFRAATVYYHLTIARKFFLEKMNSDFVKNLPPLTIRVEHSNQFSELGHFANDNYDPQYNNALTVPAGVGLASKGISPWGIEIWFRPRKEIHLRDINVNNLEAQSFMGVLSSFRKQIHMQSLQRFLATTIIALTTPGARNPLTLENVIRMSGSSIIMESSYQLIDPISRASTRKWYWLDSALVPEIIYHEFSHVALSDHLVLSHSTPVIEGMADFFAGKISNSPKLALKIKKYNTFNGKNALRKQNYVIQFERNEYANTDFVFGMLWSLQDLLGVDKSLNFVFDLRQRLTTDSSIRGQLIEGILQTCDKLCNEPFADKLKIQRKFLNRGL